MDQFTRSDLKQLIDTTQEPLVSIYMPTYRSGREVQQNSTRFKNLLKGAREKLADYGLD